MCVHPYRVPHQVFRVARVEDRFLAELFPELVALWIWSALRLVVAGVRLERMSEELALALVLAVLGLPLVIASAVKAQFFRAS